MTDFPIIYEKKLSDACKTLMHQVMKRATQVVQGFIVFNDRTIFKVHYDEEGCDEFLKSLVINKENVLTYLRRKYIPTTKEEGCLFKDQKCIQKAFIKEDGSLYIHIKNSEPHKIITDTIHVMGLLREQGFTFTPNIKFYIEQVKISFQDVRLYNLCLQEFGFKVPAPARIYEREIAAKYGKLEPILLIKKRSIKRKHLRYFVKKGELTWKQLRRILAMEDYSHHNIKSMAAEIKDENRANGISFSY